MLTPRGSKIKDAIDPSNTGISNSKQVIRTSNKYLAIVALNFQINVSIEGTTL